MEKEGGREREEGGRERRREGWEIKKQREFHSMNNINYDV